MGSCSRRHFLLSICFLQTLTIIERQVFDFLGYMWAPILANFFHIIFVIFGFYGAYLLNPKYVITYLIWNIIWIGWNIFLICFYLDVGILDKNSDILNLGTGSVSWFEVNGYGCKPVYSTNITSEDPYRPVRPQYVDDCLIDYPIVEVIHSGLQCILSALGVLGAILVAHIFIDEDDIFDFMGGDAKSPQHTTVHPMYVSYSSIPTSVNKINKKSKRHSFYSIEFGPAANTIRTTVGGGEDHILNIIGDERVNGGQLSPKPMTPRRVKRRSVMTRGTTSRQSNTSRRSSNNHTNTNRSNLRNSRRKYHQNPVTKLLDQQQQHHQHHQTHPPPPPPHHHHHSSSSVHQNRDQQQHTKAFASFSRHQSTSGNSNLIASNLKYLNTDHHNVNSIPGDDIIASKTVTSTSSIGAGLSSSTVTAAAAVTSSSFGYNNFSDSPCGGSDPIYYNTSASTIQLQQSWNTSSNSPNGGHFNPSYQHSTPNLNNSPEHDEVYNNRPPSVRSSYSNFHGTRPLSSYNLTAENVFVGITGGGSNNITDQQQISSTNIQNNPTTISSSSSQAPISPTRRTASRESIRSMAFLNNGPPAYNLNYHTPPDSETTM